MVPAQHRPGGGRRPLGADSRRLSGGGDRVVAGRHGVPGVALALPRGAVGIRLDEIPRVLCVYGLGRHGGATGPAGRNGQADAARASGGPRQDGGVRDGRTGTRAGYAARPAPVGDLPNLFPAGVLPGRRHDDHQHRSSHGGMAPPGRSGRRCERGDRRCAPPPVDARSGPRRDRHAPGRVRSAVEAGT